MPRTNKIIIRSGTAAPTASDFVTGEPAWDKTNGKFYVKNTAGTMVEIGAGGGATSVYEYATTASFPATGAAATLYIATDYGRVYRYVDSTTKYVEVGAVSSYDSRWDLFLPPAPTNVAGVSGYQQVALGWTAPTVSAQTPITSYTVQYSTNSGSTWTTWGTAPTTNSATVTSLTNGTAYTFRVLATNAVGSSAYSSASIASTPSGDPYWSTVSLLIHADGTGSTFTDSSGTPKTITVGGSATQSTVQSKFGGKSAKLANGDYLSVISSTVLTESNNYVLEFWIYPLTQTQDDRFFTIENSSGDSRGFIIDGGGFCWNKFGFPIKPLTGTITNNQWQHVALVKSGTTTSLYIDGTRASTTTSAIFPTNPTRINWGASVTNYAYAGINAYYDDIRITLNTDRGYTGATITVPAAAFSNG